MKLKALSLLFVILLLAACSNKDSEQGTNNEESADSDEKLETTEAENAEVKNESKYTNMSDETLNGSYLYTSDERRSNVTFDNGIIRFSDGEGNLTYRLANEGDRLVISDENPKVYLFLETEEGFELINIDDSGKVTESNITLESR